MAANDDWYRHTKWSPQNAAEFEEHLARSRSQKSQYLKIQAWTLTNTGKAEYADAAIELANRYLQLDPDGFFVTEVYLVIASANQIKGDVELALAAYKKAIAAEARVNGSGCCAWLDFAWFVATNKLDQEYEGALDAMDAMEDRDLTFPIAQFKYFGALALISNGLGDRSHARRMANNALDAEQRSAPFPRHKTVGVVKGINENIHKRIRAIALR